jgi:glycosyltransferase involved in cell wall biosynthesis
MKDSSKSKEYLIVAGDFVRTGGMDRANLALAEYLAKNSPSGSKIHLLGHRFSESLRKFPNIQNHSVPKPLNSNWLGEPLLNHGSQSFIRKIRQNHDPCVIVNGGNSLSKHCSINWVHYVHAAWQPSFMKVPKRSVLSDFKNRISQNTSLRHERIAFTQAPLIIANSNLTKSHISNLYQIDPARIQVVYYGTDQNEFTPVTILERESARCDLKIERNRPVVVFVGALGDSRKGFDILYDAWKILARKSDWDALLLVIGTGKLVSYYQELQRSGCCSQSIRFLGFRKDVCQILAGSDLLVSPTRYEAYGLNVHEALCRNIPVLVSESAGVAERLFLGDSQADDHDMTLPVGIDATDLADKLIYWRENQTQYSVKAARYGQMLRENSWDTQMKSLISYHHII